MGIFAQQRTDNGYSWPLSRYPLAFGRGGTGVVGIRRGLLLLLLKLQTQAAEVFPRARVLQRLGFVQESVPCRPASASSPKRHPILHQSLAGISGRLSHFVSALHPLPCISCLLPPVRNIHGSSYCRMERTLGLSLLHPYFLFSSLFWVSFSPSRSCKPSIQESGALTGCACVPVSFCTVPKPPLLGAGCLSNWENQGWPSGVS